MRCCGEIVKVLRLDADAWAMLELTCPLHGQMKEGRRDAGRADGSGRRGMSEVHLLSLRQDRGWKSMKLSYVEGVLVVLVSRCGPGGEGISLFFRVGKSLFKR